MRARRSGLAIGALSDRRSAAKPIGVAPHRAGRVTFLTVRQHRRWKVKWRLRSRGSLRDRSRGRAEHRADRGRPDDALGKLERSAIASGRERVASELRSLAALARAETPAETPAESPTGSPAGSPARSSAGSPDRLQRRSDMDIGHGQTSANRTHLYIGRYVYGRGRGGAVDVVWFCHALAPPLVTAAYSKLAGLAKRAARAIRAGPVVAKRRVDRPWNGDSGRAARGGDGAEGAATGDRERLGGAAG